MNRFLRPLARLALACALLASRPAHADDSGQLHDEAKVAIDAKRPGEAIDKLELLADRGVLDAVTSFDRGRAYAERVRSGHEEPGDLGRAIHGFEEARELAHSGPIHDQATRALEVLRGEIARRRARSGDPVEIEELSLGRSMVRLLPQDAWTLLAIACSLALTLALTARRKVKTTRVRTALGTVAAISLPVTVASAALVMGARYDRISLHEGIVVGVNVKPADARHITIPSKSPIAEGTRVRTFESDDGYVHIRTTGLNAWIPENQVLPLAKVAR